MGSTKQHVSKEYKSLLKKIGNCFTELNKEYIASRSQPSTLKDAWFAQSIVKVLLQNIKLVNSGSLRSKQDLVDSIETHTQKYIEIFQNEEVGPEVALIFQTNVTNLISQCNNKPEHSNLNSQELDIIRDQVTDLLQKSQSLFAELAYNQDTIDRLQASSIVFNIHSLPIKQQLQLMDKLLLVRELWQIENYNSSEPPDFKQNFNSNPFETLKQLETDDAESAFDQLTQIFVDKQNILQNLSNERIIELYDRLKNFEPQTPNLYNLLQKIHHEAQFRYGYNRLSDSGYELLKRFQSYDAISHQIETTEFAVAEASLLRKTTFTQDLIIAIAKHVDNIKAVGAAKLPVVKNILKKLNNQITNLHVEEHIASTTLQTIAAKFEAGIDTYIYKRYSELDKFAVNAIRNKYENFFKNIENLIDESSESKAFLQQVIVRKLAQDYYVSNLSNSVIKLRSMASDRAEIARQFATIDFVQLFSPDNINTMTSLNFRKPQKDIHSLSTAEYITSVLKNFTDNASASQLDDLYRPLKGNLTEIQSILKQEIIRQIRQRTTVTKMLYSVFTGKKKEYNKLKDIKKSIQPNFSRTIDEQELQFMKNVPSRTKKELEQLTEVAENEGMIRKNKVVDKVEVKN